VKRGKNFCLVHLDKLRIDLVAKERKIASAWDPSDTGIIHRRETL
jgi:hypothetical protein